jgi:RimJ/RimL family protein N-acetyltransferase
LKRAEIITKRFVLRPLTIKDATPRYSSWFDESASQEFIQASSSAHGVEELRDYIRERLQREDVLFLGIFTRKGAEHIGNIKFEPVDTEKKYAIMGIMIGDPAWRGKGVAAEVIAQSSRWLNQKAGIEQIVLGVDSENHAAVRAYKKAGFREEKSDKVSVDGVSVISMVLHMG